MFRKCLSSLSANCLLKIDNYSANRLIIPVANKFTKIREEYEEGPIEFVNRNNYVYPPQEPGEERRPAFVAHMKTNIKYSPKTMWYVASLVRGLSVDEAIKQLSFCAKKGAAAAKETILEAQQMAVEKHNVEFKSNLWVSESFATKGVTVKGMKRRGKMRMSKILYRHVHYFVLLEEGKPPKNYYLPEPKTKEQLLEDYKAKLRERKIGNAL
ncbi:39S ribosomal protein L22, mitochondrial isoform X2 [Chelonus insularis]|nr:39S ribosomal protein L22, mitochondrial isoform X2 [Chelonus insularis]